MTQQEYQSTNGVTELSAAELASKIRDGQLSAQEVTEAQPHTGGQRQTERRRHSSF